MPVLVTGSVAVDRIMVFRDYFKNHILPDKVHMLSVAFVVPTLDLRWGGTAANIAYNLRILEVEPILLATVGSDFGDYAAWMDAHGIRRDWIKVLDDAFTAQCFITTDLDDNQITAFHPGAMDRGHEAPLSTVDRDYAVGIVAPNGKQAMIEHARGLKRAGGPSVIDPGQGLPMFERDELRELIEGASVYIVNDYEWALTLERSDWDEDAIAERVGALIVTLGAKGSKLRRGGLACAVRVENEQTEIAVVEPAQLVDPTGCGDAYRSGVLYAIEKNLPLETGARLGSLLGSLKVACPGPQSIEIELRELRARFEREYDYSLG
jgi:adenosine kinase